MGGTTVVNWTSSFRTPEETLNHWHRRFGVAGTGRADLDPFFSKWSNAWAWNPGPCHPTPTTT